MASREAEELFTENLVLDRLSVVVSQAALNSLPKGIALWFIERAKYCDYT